ncbi:MAG: hypothetical protein HONBIEJF_02145 [Fimbriimonadaceae bacterium]|nr:hypothetical protein [Fimbriimonadaceae bacterium]
MRFSKILAVSAIVAGAIAVMAEDAASVKKWIQGQMNGYAKAVKKKDVTLIEKLAKEYFHEDFVAHEKNGTKVTRSQMLSQMKANMGMVKSVDKCDVTCKSVKVNGSTATADEAMAMTMTFAGPDAKAKPMKMDFMQTWTATYVKENGKWRCKKTVTKTEKMLMNGKPFDPSQMGGGGKK